MKNRHDGPMGRGMHKGREGFGRERGMKRGDQFGKGDMLAGALNLTDEQKKKAKAIMEAAKPKMEAIRKEEQ